MIVLTINEVHGIRFNENDGQDIISQKDGTCICIPLQLKALTALFPSRPEVPTAIVTKFSCVIQRSRRCIRRRCLMDSNDAHGWDTRQRFPLIEESASPEWLRAQDPNVIHVMSIILIEFKSCIRFPFRLATVTLWVYPTKSNTGRLQSNQATSTAPFQ